MTSVIRWARQYGLRMDASEAFIQGYADGMRLDQRGQGKPCGKGFISARKKCSAKGAQQLAADLKAGDAGAKQRVAIGKRNAQNQQALRKAVKAAAGQKPYVKPPVEQGQGGAIQKRGGELATVAKESTRDKDSTKQQSIDEKYASDNPSEADADNWLKEAVVEYSRPDKKKADAEALEEQKKAYGIHESFFVEDSPEHKLAKSIKDKDSLGDAVLAKDKQSEAYRSEMTGSQEYTWKSFSGWDGSQEQKLKSAERRAKTGKTEASRSKAQKEYDKLKAEKEEDQKTSQEAADRQNAKRSKTPEQRKAEIAASVDKKSADIYAEREALHEQVKKGNKKAIEETSRKVVFGLDTFDPMAVGGPKNYRANAQQFNREAIRSHLQNVHQKGGGDAKALGLGKGKPELKDLRAAYRRAAMAAHPDRGGSREKFEQVRSAYERMMQQHYPGERSDGLDIFEVCGDRSSLGFNTFGANLGHPPHPLPTPTAGASPVEGVPSPGPPRVYRWHSTGFISGRATGV